MQPRIVIVIEEGIIQTILCNNKEVSIQIIDNDIQENDLEAEFPQPFTIDEVTTDQELDDFVKGEEEAWEKNKRD